MNSKRVVGSFVFLFGAVLAGAAIVRTPLFVQSTPASASNAQGASVRASEAEASASASTGNISGAASARVNDIPSASSSQIENSAIGQEKVSIDSGSDPFHSPVEAKSLLPSASSAPLLPINVSVSSSAGSNALTASWTLNSAGDAPTYLSILRTANLSGPWTSVNSNYTPATSGQYAELCYRRLKFKHEWTGKNA